MLNQPPAPLSNAVSILFLGRGKTHSQTIAVILIPQSPITSRSPISTLIYAPLAQTYLNTTPEATLRILKTICNLIKHIEPLQIKLLS